MAYGIVLCTAGSILVDVDNCWLQLCRVSQSVKSIDVGPGCSCRCWEIILLGYFKRNVVDWCEVVLERDMHVVAFLVFGLCFLRVRVRHPLQ